MGACKRILEEVATEMGTDDISEPRVIEEARRRLDVEKSRFIAGTRICGKCLHWETEHSGKGCDAPGCDCDGFVAVADDDEVYEIEA